MSFLFGLVFFLFHAVFVAVILFYFIFLFLSLLFCLPICVCPFIENGVSLLGSPHLVLLPVGLSRSLPYCFPLILLLLIQGPFLFLGEGHLILANSSMLPISHSGSINIPPAWATLIHFLGLRGMALLICFYPLISSLFLGLVWDFLPLALWVHIVKSGFQHMVKL